MNKRQHMYKRGEQHAKMGMLLITVSKLILISPTITPLQLSRSTYILMGGLGTVGFVMFFAGITKYRYRAQWAFWFLLIYSLLLLMTPPVGTTLGIFSIWYLTTKRKTFFKQNIPA
ncbi:MAG: hypothetical protein ACSHYA_00945 [Opitutaceae bacterium]